MRLLVLLFFLIRFFDGSAQDTLRLSVRQADSLLVRNNFLLLADRFRLDAAQAQVLQASRLDNPNLSLELSAYNSARHRVLDVGRQGQKILTVQQLLYTAGKRNKRVALLQEAAQLTQYEFADLLRNLRFELRTRFFESYFQRQTLLRYQQQIQTLASTVEAYERQYERNNVSLRDLLRLKALLFALQNDRLEVQLQLSDNQLALRTMLGTDLPVEPQVTETALRRYDLSIYTAQALYELALRNRADLRATESLTRQAELNYNLQRALSRPDLRVGGVYDQAGSYIPNYMGLGLSLDLPVFNRNQGAILAARSQISYQQRLQDHKRLQIQNEIRTALQKAQDAEQLVQTIESRFSDQFEVLNQGVTKSFGKGNITLLECVDLIEAYNESVRQLNRLKADRIAAYEQLNSVVGDDLFHP